MSFLYITEEGSVEITADGKQLPSVKSLLEADKTKDRSKAKKAIVYVYHTYSPKSLYKNRLIEDRRKYVCNTYLDGVSPDVFEGNKHVQRIIIDFKELSMTPGEQLYEKLKEDIQDELRYLAGIKMFIEKKKKVKKVIDVPIPGSEDTFPYELEEELVFHVDNSAEKLKAYEMGEKILKQEKKIMEMMEDEKLKTRSKRIFEDR